MSTGGLIIIIIACLLTIFSYGGAKYYDSMHIFYYGIMTSLIMLIFFHLIGVEVFESYSNRGEER
jgi:hypothetical protein